VAEIEAKADFYYATNANAPTWVFITYAHAQYTLPDSAVQVAPEGRYDDVDDLVFYVAAAAGGPVAASPTEPDPVPEMERQKFGCQSLSKSKGRWENERAVMTKIIGFK